VGFGVKRGWCGVILEVQRCLELTIYARPGRPYGIDGGESLSSGLLTEGAAIPRAENIPYIPFNGRHLVLFADNTL